jgi:hypothetical protein
MGQSGSEEERTETGETVAEATETTEAETESTDATAPSGNDEEASDK